MNRVFLIVFFAIAFTIGSLAQVNTVILQPGPTQGKDAFLHGLPSLSNTNWSTDPQFCAAAWTFNSAPGVLRAVVDFDLSVIPPGAQLLSAHLSLFAWDMFSGSGFGQHSGLSGSNEAWLERITTPWVDTTVTWNNQPLTTQLNRIAIPASIAPNQDYININVTLLVQDMLSMPAAGHGFMLKLDNENYYRRLNFCSSNHPDSTKRPKLELVYQICPPNTTQCPSYSFHTVHICHRDSVFLQGAYRYSEGTFFDTLVNAQNSDSIVVTSLYIHQPISIMQSQQICDGDSILFGNTWQTTSGLYPQNYISQYGCDSTVHTALSVVVVNNSVSFSGGTLTATEAGAIYQWVDCDLGLAPIPGATSQSFTPATSGSYAVMITKAGCSVISPCIMVGNTAVPGSGSKTGFMLLPNPVTQGELTLVFDRHYQNVEIRVQNLQGQEVYRANEKGSVNTTLHLHHLSAGMYQVFVTAGGTTMSQSFVIR